VFFYSYILDFLLDAHSVDLHIDAVFGVNTAVCRMNYYSSFGLKLWVCVKKGLNS